MKRTALLFFVLVVSVGCSRKDETEQSPNSKDEPASQPQDGKGDVTAPGEIPENVAVCPYPMLQDQEVLDALAQGDGSQVEELSSLVDAIQMTFENESTRFDEALTEIFRLEADGSPGAESLTSIDWLPSHDAAFFRPRFGESAALILPNQAPNLEDPVPQEPLAVLGQRGKSRFIALGANPFRTSELGNSSTTNAQMDTLLENSVRWLMRSQDVRSKKLVLTQLDESHWFADDSSTRNWLQEHFGEELALNDSGSCDGDALKGCLELTPDLVIISQYLDEENHDASMIADELKAAMERGVPILYLQRDGGMNPLGSALLELLGLQHVRDNQWAKLSTSAFDGSALVGAAPLSYQQIRETVSHLLSGQYSFTLADAAEDLQGNESYQTEFARGASVARSLFRGYDEQGTAIFAQCDNLIDKLLVLLGDRLREEVRFPMGRESTNQTEFLRSYFADHLVYNSRATGASQPDRGNFDPRDLSAVKPVATSVTLVSRPKFRSTGLYLLPGQAARISRLDEEDVSTKLFVNPLRDGATHEWDEGESPYSRPKFLQSAHISLEPGESIVMNNPYGGPLQVEFDQSGVEVRLEFENVGQHAHWRSSADDASFAARLEDDTFNWVEVATDGFELHSRVELFEKTMADERWNTPEKLSAVIEKYTFDEVHIMAGFQGSGITERAEVHGWADSMGLSVPTLDLVKHGNMDQATCGSGCSGNPYDAYWAFTPIGHGDLHELGHSLQNGRFQLSHSGQSYGNHAVTNWTPFHSASRYYEDHGGDVPGWSIPHAHLFEELKSAYSSGERSGDFSNHMTAYLGKAIEEEGEIRNCYSFFMQAGMSARHAGVLENGYYIVPRLHLFDRALKNALQDAESWESTRDAIGWGTFSHEQAAGVSNNDFILVGLSWVTGLDFSDFFAMWGVETSLEAQAQVAEFGGPQVPRAFFALSDVDHSRAGLSTEFARIERLPIDGESTWPQ